MKVFMVFIALVIMNVNMLIFHDDLRICRQIDGQVRTAAENAASGAAMYFDPVRYADGYLVYDTGEARKVIMAQTEKLEEKLADRDSGIHWRAVFYNEDGSGMIMYDDREVESFSFQFPADGSEAELEGIELIREPTVAVRYEIEMEDVFRQPFLRADKAVGTSAYANGHVNPISP